MLCVQISGSFHIPTGQCVVGPSLSASQLGMWLFAPTAWFGFGRLLHIKSCLNKSQSPKSWVWIRSPCHLACCHRNQELQMHMVSFPNLTWFAYMEGICVPFHSFLPSFFPSLSPVFSFFLEVYLVSQVGFEPRLALASVSLVLGWSYVTALAGSGFDFVSDITALISSRKKIKL